MLKNVVLPFLRRHPLVGALLCAAIFAFVSGPKTLFGAGIAGYLPLASHEATIVELKSEMHRGRRGRTTEHCYAYASDEKVRIDCSENLRVGETLQVFDSDGSPVSREFARGHFYFDLALSLLEIFGVIYFGMLFMQSMQANRRAESVPG